MLKSRFRTAIAMTLLALSCAFVPAARSADITLRVDPDSYAAIAYSPTTGVYRYAYNHRSRSAAEGAALRAVNDKDARIVCWVNHGFCVLALGDDKAVWGTGWEYGPGASFLDAQLTALEECRKRTTGARIVVGLTSDGQYVHEPEKKRRPARPQAPVELNPEPTVRTISPSVESH